MKKKKTASRIKATVHKWADNGTVVCLHSSDAPMMRVLMGYYLIICLFKTKNRAATAALVEKQSKEMMNLINEKRSEFMRAESLFIDHDPMVFADIDQIAISVRVEQLMSYQNLSNALRVKRDFHFVVVVVVDSI